MNSFAAPFSAETLEATVTMLQEELEATNHEVMLLTLELEQRVAERTAELLRTNIDLRKEVAEKLRAEAEVRHLNKNLERRAELLQVANQELEAFSSSVSHDLRNPLTRITGFATILQETAGSTLDEKNRRYLAKICDSGRKMSALIEDLLRLSRASHVKLHRTAVNLNELVDGVLSEMEHDTRDRKINWRRHSLPTVSGDSSLLRQVFVNLIVNALKYTRPRDPAEIDIGPADPAGEEWVFFVRDNGVGFDPNKAAQLFGPFQRLHSSEDFEGTGLGLANVRRIVLRHGGRVWAEGRQNAGATFYVSLPKNP